MGNNIPWAHISTTNFGKTIYPKKNHSTTVVSSPCLPVIGS